MIIAKNNIIVKINSSLPEEYAIFNPVSGSFDIMDAAEYISFCEISKDAIPDNELSSYLLERGYIYLSKEAQIIAIDKAYKEFKDEIDNSQVQLLIVPTYNCNFACTYCFQHGIEGKPTLISLETVDAFFDYAQNNFNDKNIKPFITLFGGEPLVNSQKQKEMINYIIDKASKYGYELSVVSNGYDLIDYIDSLKKAKINEIQITLDGSQEAHDKRRITANQKGTFERIVEGLEAAVAASMPINLRTVVDLENINDIVNLADFLDKKGYLDLPKELFKTQIGRNYELFECYAKPQHLMTQVELWGEYTKLCKEYPILAKFHKPDFKGLRHLVETGEMYLPSFDTCPACKTEWIFDLYGNIYGCTASCGREEFLLGTFWPIVNLNEDTLNIWKQRDVTTIPKCRDCKYDVICGGGCGVVAANNNNGEILSPDCRPIQELMDIGINYYIDDIKEMANEDITSSAASCCCQAVDGDLSVDMIESLPIDIAEDLCCTPKHEIKTEGCLVCGNALIYSPNIHDKISCFICGENFETNVKCSENHYICDDCHSSGILEKVLKFLLISNIQNPVELAEKIFELPGLNMHGPEYHSIVPAVIVRAYQNVHNIADASKISQAIRRGKDTKGGSCGYNGTCGAGVGAGIALSIIENATPVSKESRGNALRVTGHALLDISVYDGPRCCKREAITAIQSFINSTNYFEGVSLKNYRCKQFLKNKECIGKKCSYFPSK